MTTASVINVSRRPDRPVLSIVVPVYNEEVCVTEMVTRLASVFADASFTWEVIFVDDGSSDRTLARIRDIAAADERIQFLSFSRNFGHQLALTAGIDHAHGDAVVTLDGDLQHPPELIPALVERWREGYDVVYTIRTSNRGHPVKEIVSRAYYWLLRKLTGVDVPSGGADFRLMDRTVVDALRQCRERNVFVRGLVPWLGFTRTAVPYDAARRFSGKTKYATRRMLRFALDGVLAFSIIPLRLIALLGALTVGLGILYGVYTLLVRIFSDRVASGWTSLMIVILVFSGTQLLSLGILSEYVGRIYEEVKQRPRYVVSRMSPRLRAQHEKDRA